MDEKVEKALIEKATHVIKGIVAAQDYDAYDEFLEWLDAFTLREIKKLKGIMVGQRN